MSHAIVQFLRTSWRYAAIEVNCPGQMATVLVALACTGRIPVPSSAGKERNEPPPATAFSTPARKAAATSQTQCQLMVAAKPVIRTMWHSL